MHIALIHALNHHESCISDRKRGVFVLQWCLIYKKVLFVLSGTRMHRRDTIRSRDPGLNALVGNAVTQKQKKQVRKENANLDA